MVRGRILLYAATAGTSAFLLFTLELMVGRMLLPRFGGSPGVWNTALCFFQVALVVGYGWAGAGRRLGQRAHKLAQLLLVAAVGLLLPPGLPAGWQPTGTSPSLDALLILTARIGVPFIALATTT